MQKVTDTGWNIVTDLSSRYSISTDAVMHMLIAVNNGAGSMAQFNCPELGGGGQWMRGGMTMVGDMFNHGLKMTVDNLCNELANALANNQMFPKIPAGTPGSSQWWPADLGSPSSSGSQNNTRYAVFFNRLAVEVNGDVIVYDTLDHNIGGVSQQQGGNTSLSFSSQYGTVSVDSLPIVSGAKAQAPSNTNFLSPTLPNVPPSPQHDDNNNHPGSDHSHQESDKIITLLEKLAQLKDAGILSDEEYNVKKSELLARI